MNLFGSTTTIAAARKNRSPLRRAFLLIPLVLACLWLSPTAQAANETTSNLNTGEGIGALQSVTTGTHNTALGFDAMFSDTTGVQNTATGSQALFKNTTGFQNTATGFRALVNNTTGFHNTANGFSALFSTTTGNHNTANGDLGLLNNTTGNFNTTAGAHSLVHNTTGSLNIALGFAAGQNLTVGSNNIDVANGGVAGESNTIRVGNEVAFTDIEGVTHPAHTATFIAGISGVAVTGTNVVISSQGRLGVVVSSEGFKDEIKTMDNASQAILALRPVTFRYKKEIDPERTAQFGLVAEEVEKVNPALITRGRDGKPYTVRYEAVNAMLLNEFLKEHRKVHEQEATIAQLKSAAARQEATAVRQQKQIEALTTGLQKVSDQLELNKSAPQRVANNE